MSDFIKLSSPATHEFWEIPVLFEDEHLLAVDKPAQLLVSPDPNDPARPNLMALLRHDIERGAPWAKARAATFLDHAYRLDFDASGVLLLAKSKEVLIPLLNELGSEKPNRAFVALARGSAEKDGYLSEAKLAPNPLRLGHMKVNSQEGKRSRTEFSVRERFAGFVLMECRPLTDRLHQIQLHLRHLGFPVVGDSLYGGSNLLLSSLKTDYRLKPGKTERPLLSRTALHAETLVLPHPVTGAELKVAAPWPKDLTVAIKYLRLYAALSTGLLQE